MRIHKVLYETKTKKRNEVLDVPGTSVKLPIVAMRNFSCLFSVVAKKGWIVFNLLPTFQFGQDSMQDRESEGMAVLSRENAITLSFLIFNLHFIWHKDSVPDMDYIKEKLAEKKKAQKVATAKAKAKPVARRQKPKTAAKLARKATAKKK